MELKVIVLPALFAKYKYKWPNKAMQMCYITAMYRSRFYMFVSCKNNNKDKKNMS